MTDPAAPFILVRDAVFAAIDFESAGVSPGSTDFPVQIGIAVMRGDGEILTDRFFVSYLHAAGPVTWQASKVHGITAADLKDAPTLTALWPEIQGRLRGAAVVAHGAGTEKRFLRAFPLHGFSPWVDTLKLARTLWPGLRDYSLETLIHSAGLGAELDALVPSRRFHDALYDAAASLLLLRFLTTQAGLFDAPLSRIAR